MESFLKIVAEDLYNRVDGDFTDIAIIFPNKRASLFFNEHIASISEKPLWSPSYLSIQELFHELSEYQSGDQIKMVCELYKIYVSLKESNESLDDFYTWGEMMISDFDDVDKNLVDSEKLFSNLRDLKDLEDIHYLDEEQEEAIKEFFKNFSIEKRTELKDKFISMWNILGKIYTQFKSRLESLNIAYEGMLYRNAIEKLDISKLRYKNYVFIGFNVLNKVENKLFSILQENGKATFYWDYDKYYMNGAFYEAGEAIKKNLIRFPSSLDENLFDNMSKPKEINIISSPTENGQVRYLPTWIKNNLTESQKETAVVLCNETLLQPVIHSIPEEVEHVNITMGFPLSQTPIFSFITSYLELQLKGYNQSNGKYLYNNVIDILKHPYTRELSSCAEELEKELTEKNRFYPLPSELRKDDFLNQLFIPQPNNEKLCESLNLILQLISTLYKGKDNETDAFNQLYIESLFQSYTIVSRFRTLIEDGDLKVKSETFRRLFIKVLSATNIPFHGEPAIGMQIMGVLETRNLDFKHLIMLSVNEGQLPKAGMSASYIPYNLKKAFSMTTIENKMTLYAYYFYRLIQRAEKITLLYNTATDGLNKGEYSRFILQLLIDSKNEINRYSLQAGQTPKVNSPIIIEKSNDIMKRLQEKFDIRVDKKNNNARFSPSALNAYLDCSLKFYYKYVVGLKSKDEITTDIDPSKFGTIFHYVAENIYNDLSKKNKVISKDEIENLLKDEIRLYKYVDDAFKEKFFQVKKDEKPEYNGLQLINSEVIKRYIKQLLKKDVMYAPFTYGGSETRIKENIDINTSKGTIKSSFGGIIDRMDIKDDTLRIVDYKTGGDAETLNNIESLFTKEKKRSHYIFQTFLYAAIMCRQQSHKVAPSLLYIHRAASKDYSPIIKMGEARKEKEEIMDFSILEEEFREHLRILLEEIFNQQIPFEQTEIEDFCEYCDFKQLCQKG